MFDGSSSYCDGHMPYVAGSSFLLVNSNVLLFES